MKRREFITLLGNAALYSVAARARQLGTLVIRVPAILSPTSPVMLSGLEAFRRGLAENGYVERKNVSIDLRSADGRQDRIPMLVAELVASQVDVIVAGGTPTALAAKAATKTIPIVFDVGVDPVAAGLVASLSRPGGNLTGISNLLNEVGPKRVELMHELVPAARVFALLINPSNPEFTRQETDAMSNAWRALELQVHLVEASDESAFDSAFATVAQLGAGALLVSGDALFRNGYDQLVALAARHRVPALYPYYPEFAAAGGLMSYGYNVPDEFRQLGVYVARILNGDKPADLPVIQPTRFELVVNLKTARVLGLVIPPTILARADEVIE